MSEYVPTTEDMQEQFVAGAMLTGFAYSREEARSDWADYLAAHDREVKAKALREAADWLDDPRALPDIDENAAVAVIRELRYRADRIEGEES